MIQKNPDRTQKKIKTVKPLKENYTRRKSVKISPDFVI